MENSGLDQMIDLHKMDDLARLYRLFITVPAGLPCLKRSLKDSIARRGREINQASLAIDAEEGEPEDDAEHKGKGKGKSRAQNAGAQTLALALKWVQDVLDLKDLFDSVWERALERDREIESSLNEVSRPIHSRVPS